MRKDYCVIIPAIKKNAIIPDQLVKKLNGITLIQRAINTAKEMREDSDIYVITDSEEISLIAERNNLHYYYNPTLQFNSKEIYAALGTFLMKEAKNYQFIFLYRGNTPLLEVSVIKDAINYFRSNRPDMLISIKEEPYRIWHKVKQEIEGIFLEDKNESILVEIKAFIIINSDFIRSEQKEGKILPYKLDGNTIEIDGYLNWWICEKLLKRRKILFVVKGYPEIGMGHIYRALTLAHEINDHEIVFLCTKESELAIKKIAEKDYPTFIQENDLLTDVLSHNPDLVINDILNTDFDYINGLKKADKQVVSFEDLGAGATATDLTFNELYDEKQFNCSHCFWGHEYMFLRDEFLDARKHSIDENVKEILVTFGGTDSNNYTLKVLKSIYPFCNKNNIKINIVTGAGFLFKHELQNYLKRIDSTFINYTDATGVISQIMERTQLAITSNGRTVYELAHLHIPSIVISHHERETTHLFASLENGFINLGIYNENKTNDEILHYLEKLFIDVNYRKKLIENTYRFDFIRNKKKVVEKILSLIQ
jgi:spore coat polysaccharide biosynthesis predicted glycosyltransferase SpsG/CMP-N-acetylneuraminic acid synthetase